MTILSELPENNKSKRQRFGRGPVRFLVREDREPLILRGLPLNGMGISGSSAPDFQAGRRVGNRVVKDAASRLPGLPDYYQATTDAT